MVTKRMYEVTRHQGRAWELRINANTDQHNTSNNPARDAVVVVPMSLLAHQAYEYAPFSQRYPRCLDRDGALSGLRGVQKAT